MKQFILAVDTWKNGQMDLEWAQVEHIGCTAQEIMLWSLRRRKRESREPVSIGTSGGMRIVF